MQDHEIISLLKEMKNAKALTIQGPSPLEAIANLLSVQNWLIEHFSGLPIKRTGNDFRGRSFKLG